MFSIAGVIRQRADERPDQAALVCDDRMLTYRQLHDESSRVANELAPVRIGRCLRFSIAQLERFVEDR